MEKPQLDCLVEKFIAYSKGRQLSDRTVAKYKKQIELGHRVIGKIPTNVVPEIDMNFFDLFKKDEKKLLAKKSEKYVKETIDRTVRFIKFQNGTLKEHQTHLNSDTTVSTSGDDTKSAEQKKKRDERAKKTRCIKIRKRKGKILISMCSN